MLKPKPIYSMTERELLDIARENAEARAQLEDGYNWTRKQIKAGTKEAA